MSYIVFARKYRPKSFDEITGQSHITTTLKNAIEQSRVAHAYLFAGPRGVGKTTTARILAKALNCEKGPIAKPCDKCSSCREIASGSSLDIFEIDGASSRGIDEIRSLRENAKFAPSRDRFRVYIIDEVHMLTPEAFNALLKTLEEPPPHVKFIFATTHAHKVPPTILSRCQRFDFRRIPVREILDNLKHIVKEEKLSIDDDALGLMAKHSDGSMRDAQVMLDQIASFVSGKIGAGDVAKILGIVDDEILFGLSGAIHDKDPKAALKIIDELVADGKDVMQAVSGMIEHFRNISITKVAKELDPLIGAGSDKIERYRAESEKFTMEQILYIIYSLANTIDFMRKTDMARIPFEATLVKLTLGAGVVSIADILKRVEALESKAPTPAGRIAKAALFESEPTAQAAVSHEPAFESQIAPPQPDKIEDNAGEDIGSGSSIQQSANMDEILSSWTKVISYIKSRKISIASYLQEGDPVGLEGNALTIGFSKQSQFHKEVLESLENRKIIEAAIKETLGMDLRVILVVAGLNASNNRLANMRAQGADSPDGDNEATAEAAVEDTDPIVKKALEMFGGKLAGPANGRRA